MSIPISEYINVPSKIAASVAAPREYIGLVFVTDALSVDPDYASQFADAQAAFTAGKAIRLSYTGVVAMFGKDAKITKFASKYFGYVGPNGTPRAIAVAKYTAGDEADAFATATADFTNFGSFTFLGADADTINPADFPTATSCLIVAVDKGDTYPAALKAEGTHSVIGNPEDGVNYAAWMPMSWYASIDYAGLNVAGTIDYKRFDGEIPTVDSLEGKTAADTAMMNYVGKVQSYGSDLAFYQKGKNGDGVDLGVFRDKSWIQSEIELGWFNLAGNVNKIPANSEGASMVYGIVADTAARGVENGAILIDKPLSSSQKAEITQYANDAAAVEDVITNGFYISVDVVNDGTDYVCRYLLIYAKGDHIGKVYGQHVLV